MPNKFPTLFGHDEIEVPQTEVLHYSHAKTAKSDDDLERESLLILADEYPHIYTRIVETWGSKELYDYFDRLIIADRSDRQGFPPKILMALMVLGRIHAQKYRLQTKLIDHWAQSKK